MVLPTVETYLLVIKEVNSWSFLVWQASSWSVVTSCPVKL